MRTINSDKMWKAMIHDLLEYIIAYHYPEHYDLIDWTKPYEFLNLELAQLSPLSPQKGRIADVLVKLYLKNGTQVFFLFHIEVQNYPDLTMPKRVYQMLYRTEERFGICPEILVLYIDEKKDYNPQQYTHQVWATRVQVDYKTFKLLDNPPSQNPQPDNPYTMILELVYWAMLRNSPSEEIVMQIQLDLIDRLVKQKFPIRVINSSLTFLVHYIKFADSKNRTNFEQKLNEIMQTVQIKGVVEVVREMLAEEAEKRIKRAEAKRKKAVEATLKAEEAMLKAKEATLRAENDAMKAKEATLRAENDAMKAKDDAMKAKIDQQAKTEFAVIQLLKQGIDKTIIANAFDLPLQTILDIQEKISKIDDIQL